MASTIKPEYLIDVHSHAKDSEDTISDYRLSAALHSSPADNTTLFQTTYLGGVIALVLCGNTRIFNHKTDDHIEGEAIDSRMLDTLESPESLLWTEAMDLELVESPWFEWCWADGTAASDAFGSIPINTALLMQELPVDIL